VSLFHGIWISRSKKPAQIFRRPLTSELKCDVFQNYVIILVIVSKIWLSWLTGSLREGVIFLRPLFLVISLSDRNGTSSRLGKRVGTRRAVILVKSRGNPYIQDAVFLLQKDPLLAKNRQLAVLALAYRKKKGIFGRSGGRCARTAKEYRNTALQVP
jgi:hypothetical protein